MLKPSKEFYEYSVLDYSVTDADTVQTLLDLGFDVYSQMACRLYGIDTPELNTQAGKLVRLVVVAWAAKQTKLLALSIARDKYAGRYVGRIKGCEFGATTFTSINDILWERRLAHQYYGGTKLPWTPEELAIAEQNATIVLKEFGIYPTKTN